MSKIRWCGIDVSQRWMDASSALADKPHAGESKRFENTASGHAALIEWLRRGKSGARVVLEATGNYGLDLSMALHRSPGIEVMVLNPRAAKHFGEALMQRTRTDLTAAEVLRQYAERMEFEPWQPPSEQRLALRAIGRRMQSLGRMRSAERNRLHAVQISYVAGVEVVIEDIKAHQQIITKTIQALEKQAYTLVGEHADLARAYRHLLSVRGIGRRSALLILGELACLPAGLGARQWVAFAGLDPRLHRSGTSVNPPVRISRMGSAYLRTALFMPALTAMRHDPGFRQFAQQLVDRGKLRMQAVVAVMRKLLHAIHGMLKNDADYDGSKLFASLRVAALAAVEPTPQPSSASELAVHTVANAITAPQRGAQGRSRAPRGATGARGGEAHP